MVWQGRDCRHSGTQLCEVAPGPGSTRDYQDLKCSVLLYWTTRVLPMAGPTVAGVVGPKVLLREGPPLPRGASPGGKSHAWDTVIGSHRLPAVGACTARLDQGPGLAASRTVSAPWAQLLRSG